MTQRKRKAKRQKFTARNGGEPPAQAPAKPRTNQSTQEEKEAGGHAD